MYLMSSLKDKHIELDLETFQADDMVFLPFLLSMPVNKIHIFKTSEKKKTTVSIGQSFYETFKFKDFLKEIANAI